MYESEWVMEIAGGYTMWRVPAYVLTDYVCSLLFTHISTAVPYSYFRLFSRI